MEYDAVQVVASYAPSRPSRGGESFTALVITPAALEAGDEFLSIVDTMMCAVAGAGGTYGPPLDPNPSPPRTAFEYVTAWAAATAGKGWRHVLVWGTDTLGRPDLSRAELQAWIDTLCAASNGTLTISTFMEGPAPDSHQAIPEAVARGDRRSLKALRRALKSRARVLILGLGLDLDGTRALAGVIFREPIRASLPPAKRLDIRVASSDPPEFLAAFARWLQGTDDPKVAIVIGLVGLHRTDPRVLELAQLISEVGTVHGTLTMVALGGDPHAAVPPALRQ